MINFQKNNGFTLIEVIISIAIVGILLLASLSYFANNTIYIFSAGERTDSVFEAQNRIDNTIKDIDFADGSKEIEIEELPINFSIKFNSNDGISFNADNLKGKIVTVKIENNTPITITTYVSK